MAYNYMHDTYEYLRNGSYKIKRLPPVVTPDWK